MHSYALPKSRIIYGILKITFYKSKNVEYIWSTLKSSFHNTIQSQITRKFHLKKQQKIIFLIIIA